MGLPFFTYMLRRADESYYVGHTDDLEKRVAEHQAGETGGYTESRRPVQLVWCEEFTTREEARAAEVQSKKWSRAKKVALAAGDFDALRRAARKKDWAAHHERQGRR